MSDQNLTPPEQGFIEHHFPRLYELGIQLIGIITPNVELRYELVQALVKNQNLERELESVKHDYCEANQQAWNHLQDFEMERGAAITRKKKIDELVSQNQTLTSQNSQLTQEFQNWHDVYQQTEQSNQTLLKQLQQELQTTQQQYVNLEQIVRKFSSQKNLHLNLDTLNKEYDLRELISPEDLDDFEYRCAISQIYTPTNDNIISQDLETALLASLEKTAKTKIYQHVTLHIADKLFNENFPKTASSLYNTLLKYFNSDKYQPNSPQETKYTNIKETRDRLTTIIKTNPQHTPAVFEIAHLNLQNQHYNLAEELGITLANATNEPQYWQFIGDVIMQGPYANRPKSIQWAQQCYQKAATLSTP